jgi:hypothetical protein
MCNKHNLFLLFYTIIMILSHILKNSKKRLNFTNNMYYWSIELWFIFELGGIILIICY